jgi:hypothetical protein
VVKIGSASRSPITLGRLYRCALVRGKELGTLSDTAFCRAMTRYNELSLGSHDGTKVRRRALRVVGKYLRLLGSPGDYGLFSS